MSITLVLGGARSGKSRYAERLCLDNRVFVATAQAFDGEMTERIALHRQQRGGNWTTVEAPLALIDALRLNDQPERFVLVDCLTLWLSNLMLAEKDCEAEFAALERWAQQHKGTIVFVSNELGLGLVPETALGRRFRDLHGVMNQRVAALAGSVVLVVAGLPLGVKGRLPG